MKPLIKTEMLDSYTELLRKTVTISPEILEAIVNDITRVSVGMIAKSLGMQDPEFGPALKRIEAFAEPQMLQLLALLARKALIQEAAEKFSQEFTASISRPSSDPQDPY